jgi:phytoene dehydrogenase-like protein
VTEKKIVVVGAGMAGLSAGCYARMNGYRTTILEMHDRAGGLLTAWRRNGYTIDGCIHWLVGSGPGAGFHRVWQELGVVQGREFVHAERFLRLEWPDGRCFDLLTDPDRLERHIAELAPEDAAAGRDLADCVRAGLRADLPLGKPAELQTFFDRLKFAVTMGPRFAALGRWFRYSTAEYARRFKSDLVRAGITSAWHDDFPLLFIALTLGWIHKGAAGYPIGGSLGLARAVEQRYIGLGGELRLRSRVSGIMVEHDRAVGVRLADGSEVRADCVIWAADSHTALFDLLDPRYLHADARWPFEHLKPFPALVFVGLGVNRTFPDVPALTSCLQIRLPEPVEIGGEPQAEFGIRIFNQDPTLAPAGRTVLTVMLPSSERWWREIAADRNRYQAEKARIAGLVVAVLEKRFPGIAGQVEMRDVATPLTFIRYTGNWQGSFEGWLVTPQTWQRRIARRLPGLDSFYLCGHWVEPGGGLPPAAQSGRDVVRLICHRDRRRFVTVIAPNP